MENNLPRDFKGIWIPREIWLDQTMNYFEKCLLAEIHSLNGQDGCFASNEYLCNFFNEKERKIQDALAKLKAKGYIYIESFDGRTRILRTNLNPENDKSKFSTSGVQDSAPLGCQISHPSTGKDTLYRKKKENKDIASSRGAISFTEIEEKQLSAHPPDLIKKAMQILHDECKALSNESRKKFLFSVIERLKNEKSPQDNKTLAEKMKASIAKMPHGVYFEILNDCVEIGHCNSQKTPEQVKYSERGFSDMIDKARRMYNIVIKPNEGIKS